MLAVSELIGFIRRADAFSAAQPAPDEAIGRLARLFQPRKANPPLSLAISCHKHEFPSQPVRQAAKHPVQTRIALSEPVPA
jgi:hypothetical protein